jgi:hypothetical protein
VLRDLKLFGPPEKDLSRYLRAKAWELEEAVALGLGRHPRNLSLSVIREKCPEQIDLQCKARPEDLLPTAQLLMDRCELLKRAAFIGDIKSEERDGKIWFKLVDLATYAHKEWDYMPASARALMAAAVIAAANTGFADHSEKKEATAPATATEAGAGTFAPVSENTPAGGHAEPQDGHSSSLGVSEGEKGEAACKAWLISKMRRSPHNPPFKTQKELRQHCMTKFSISWGAAQSAWMEAKEATGCTWHKRGRPSA